MSTRFMPASAALRAAFRAATEAEYGVPYLVPLKPTVPAEAHEKTLPSPSVTDTIVLLNVL